MQRFYLADLDYKLIAFNKAAKDLIKAEFNHILKKGDNLIDFFPSEERTTLFQKSFNKAKKDEHIIYKENIFINNDEDWIEVHLEPVKNEKGEIDRILLWTLDITKEKFAEDALKKNNIELEDKIKLRTKELVEEKNKNKNFNAKLIESINYAHKIEKAVLPYNERQYKFFPDSFVFFQTTYII